MSVTIVCPGYLRTQFSINALAGDGNKHGVMDATTSRGMTPGHAARAVLEGVAEGKREFLLAKPLHQVGVYLKVFCPSLLDWILRHREN